MSLSTDSSKVQLLAKIDYFFKDVNRFIGLIDCVRLTGIIITEESTYRPKWAVF